MPDPSADRPLLLPDLFTEEDVVLVGDAIGDRSIARTALRVLNAAGRLLPPDAERREEWGVVWRGPSGGVVLTEGSLLSRVDAEIQGRQRVGHYDIASFTVRQREHRMFDDGSTLTGPWVEADGSAE